MKKLFVAVCILLGGCNALVQIGGTTNNGLTSNDAAKLDSKQSSILSEVVTANAKLDKMMKHDNVPALTLSELLSADKRAADAEKKAEKAKDENKKTSTFVHKIKITLIILAVISILAGIAHELGTIKTGIVPLDVAIVAMGVVWHVLIAIVHVAWKLLCAAWRIGFALAKKLFVKIHSPKPPTPSAVA